MVRHDPWRAARRPSQIEATRPVSHAGSFRPVLISCLLYFGGSSALAEEGGPAVPERSGWWDQSTSTTRELWDDSREKAGTLWEASRAKAAELWQKSLEAFRSEGGDKTFSEV